MITTDDLIEFGYKRFPIPVHMSGHGVSAFYQKKVEVLEDNAVYYIDAVFYLMQEMGKKSCNIVEFTSQFNEEPGTTFNVSTVGWANERSTLEQAEDFFRAQYELSKVFRKLKEH